MITEYNDIKVTMFMTTDMGLGVIKQEVRLKSIEQGKKYAQYNNAVKVVCKQKRKRSYVGRHFTYNPYVIIVEGWDIDLEQNPFNAPEDLGYATIQKAKYACFDDRYATDFDTLIDNANVNVIFDFRHTKGANPYHSYAA